MWSVRVSSSGQCHSHSPPLGRAGAPNGGLLLRVPSEDTSPPSQVCNYSGFAPSVSAVHSNVAVRFVSRSPPWEQGMRASLRRANAQGTGRAARSNRCAHVRREGDAQAAPDLEGAG